MIAPDLAAPLADRLLALVIPLGLIVASAAVGDRMAIPREPFVACLLYTSRCV